MRKRSEVTVNLVRPQDDETYAVLSDFEMTILRCRETVLPERMHVDEKSNTHVRYYIRMPRD